MRERIIFHIDMDAFFASVEECRRPWLKGKPVVVGADPAGGKGRGVVATANYAARSYGIRSALPITTAWRLAEEARKKGKEPVYFLGGDHRRYSETSRRIMEIFRAYAEAVEPASIDEAYLQIKFPIHNFKFSNSRWKYAEGVARKIKREILQKEKLTCSVGIGPNKLIAKIASGREKPDGLTVVRPESVPLFLDPLPIREIPGVGPKVETILRQHGIRTVKDLRGVSKSELSNWLGKWGIEIFQKVRGVDESPVEESYETKSIGEQETLAEDSGDPDILISLLMRTAKSVFATTASERFLFRTVSITVRFSDFETKTRSRTPGAPIEREAIFVREAMRLFLPFLDRRENPGKKKIRLLGVRAEQGTRQAGFSFD